MTLEALAHKTDLRARAKERVAHTKASAAYKGHEWIGKAKQASPSAAASAASRASHKARENPLPFAVAASVAAGFAAGRILKR
jgi:hypothetical protein